LIRFCFGIVGEYTHAYFVGASFYAENYGLIFVIGIIEVSKFGWIGEWEVVDWCDRTWWIDAHHGLEMTCLLIDGCRAAAKYDGIGYPAKNRKRS
jgi:hypothetical protein